MTERMKRFLEEKFRAVAPTKSAMEFRKQTLKRMQNYAQELQIKGLDDEDLAFELCVDELGDFDKTLREFEENHQMEVKERRKTNFVLLGIAVGVFALVIGYLLMGLLGGLWHPGWLLIVCGTLLGVCAGAILFAVKCGKNKKWILMRLCTAVAVVMTAVIVFLCWQLLAFRPRFAWYTFLVMVGALFLVDTVIAFITKSKIAFWESLVAFLVAVVMIYVMAGVALPHFWHPGWLMMPIAVFIDLVAVIGRVWFKRSQKAKKLKADMADRLNGVDEKYYTEW